MSNVYIPDLTERFPEGFGGVDLTDSYFPPTRRNEYSAYEYIKQLEREYEREEEQWQLDECLNGRR